MAGKFVSQDSPGKMTARLMLADVAFNHLSGRKNGQPVNCLTLPASNFIFEGILQQVMHKDKLYFTCCEKDPVVYEEAVKASPRNLKAFIIPQDVFRLSKGLGTKYDFVWLDLCSQLCPTNWNQLMSFVQGRALADECIFAVTLLRAREMGMDNIKSCLGCTDLNDFRNVEFVKNLKTFAGFKQRTVEHIGTFGYRDDTKTHSSPMNLYIFKITKNKLYG